MNGEAAEIQRRVSESVRDMLNEYRLQAHVGPVTDKALEEILFRAAHGVVDVLESYPRELRVAMLPSLVRMLLAAFLEEIAITDEADRVNKRGDGGATV
jgi:hypothetical protein